MHNRLNKIYQQSNQLKHKMHMKNRIIQNSKKIEIIEKLVKINKKRDESNLFDYFTFDDFNSFERVNLFSVVVNFRC